MVTYFVTWFAAIIWGLLFWVLRTKKAWFYPAAIINSALGCLGRGIPGVLMTIGFFSTPRTDLLFTPSWVPAILNLVILIVLLIPTYKEKVRDYINEVDSSSSESVGSQVSQLSPVLFGFGLVMIIQPFIMPTHIIDGVNIASSYGSLLASGLLQFYSGLFFIALSIITQIFGKLINIAYSSGPLLVES
ncbi:MAG: hypothetical protein ACFFFH_14500 [Candidatus Thorarchaeota archaeon]